MSKYSTATNLKHLKKVAEYVIADSAKFMQNLAKHKAEVDKKKEAIAKALEMTDPARLKTAAAHYDSEHNDWLKSYRKQTESERYALLWELSEAEKAVGYAKENLTDPKKVSTLFMLGSEERFRLESSLEKMGNASLGALASRAKAERHTPEGKLLASVVILANDRMPRNSRLFDSHQLAEEVWGEECKEVREHCKLVEREFTVARALNGEFDGRAITGAEKIAIGLRFEGNTLNEPAATSREPNSTDKILAGLKDMDEASRKANAEFDASMEMHFKALDELDAA